MEPGGWQTPLAVLVMSSPFFLPPWLYPMISSYLSLHLNPPHPPWFPFSSHPPSPLPFPRGSWPFLRHHSLSTVADALSTECRGTDTTWYPCCHITTFPCCEEACQSPVPHIANWELSPAGNSLQTQLADLEIFLTEARNLRLSILAIMKTLNQIRSSIWLTIKANPLKKTKPHTQKKPTKKHYFLIGLITWNYGDHLDQVRILTCDHQWSVNQRFFINPQCLLSKGSHQARHSIPCKILSKEKVPEFTILWFSREEETSTQGLWITS